MTKLLEQALDQVRKLPDAEQDFYAAVLLEQMRADGVWDELFARPESGRFLASLAKEAQQVKAAGEIQPLDPDAL